MSVLTEKFEVHFEPPSLNHTWKELSSALEPAYDRSESSMRFAVDDSHLGDTFVQSTMAGETDVSNNVNGKTLVNGYGKLKMRPTDDMYTDEHVDPYYRDVGGFCERNNVLDRE